MRLKSRELEQYKNQVDAIQEEPEQHDRSYDQKQEYFDEEAHEENGTTAEVDTYIGEFETEYIN